MPIEGSSEAQDQQIIRELSLPIYQARGWMKLLGVMMVLQGIITALTVVGLIICWLPIWLGVLLFKAAGTIEGAQLSGNRAMMVESLNKIKTYFLINGVLMLVMIGFAAISLLITGAGILTLFDRL